MPRPYKILLGNCCELLRTLPRRSVQCVVTSPPYYGLRDYGTAEQVWGGRRRCRHRWRSQGVSKQRLRNDAEGGLHSGRKHGKPLSGGVTTTLGLGATCRKCGAWRGHLGLEPTPELYVQHLVAVFRGLRRVLRRDGTVWLNLGDSYWGGKGASNYAFQTRRKSASLHHEQHNIQSELGALRPQDATHPTIKSKDLVGIPWRVAFALQAAGWYLRSDVIWAKPNPMPESTTDRPTRAHEYLFLLSKRAHYFYDAEAIKEPSSGDTRAGTTGAYTTGRITGSKREQSANGQTTRGRLNQYCDGQTRNRRSVWTIPTKGYKGAHFAVMPEALVEPCIKASTSERGCCPHCGQPWQRVVKKAGEYQAKWGEGSATMDARIGGGRNRGLRDKVLSYNATVGWQPTCTCARHKPVPCRVLDPFNGAGTTGVVAVKLHRHYLGLELNADYIRLAKQRLRRARRTPQAQLTPLFG
jgi:DNA modification methylase